MTATHAPLTVEVVARAGATIVDVRQVDRRCPVYRIGEGPRAHAPVAVGGAGADGCVALIELRGGSPWLGLQSRVTLAWARAELGDAGQARALLSEVRDLAGDSPPPLVEAWGDRALALVDGLSGDAGGPALTTAELRTLQYLPTHLALREIGERLHVSRNTVKTHAVAIYRKLDVASRSEAVARGRELGLLDD